MNFDIPVGLTDLLQEFTVAVLRERPPDLVTFAANYFNKLNDSRTCYNLEQKSSVRFVASPSSDELDHNDQDLDEDFGKLQLPALSTYFCLITVVESILVTSLLTVFCSICLDNKLTCAKYFVYCLQLLIYL